MVGHRELSFRGKSIPASDHKVITAPNPDTMAICTRATSAEPSPELRPVINSGKDEPPSMEMDRQVKSAERPQNFGVIAPGAMYRSSFPDAEDLPFLEGLKLKTIVTLVQKDFSKHFHDFVDKHGIAHHIVEMKGTKKEEIPAETMGTILQLILDKRRHPVLIHCKQGRHRTGCVVGAVRKVLGWSLGPILDEYKAFAEPKPRECDITYLIGFQPARFSQVVANHITHPIPLTSIGRANRKTWRDMTARGRMTLILTALIVLAVMVHAARPGLFFPHDGF